MTREYSPAFFRVNVAAVINSIAKLRRNRRLIRTLCAVWLLAWLQTALVPCTMAMEIMGRQAPAAVKVMQQMAMTHAAAEQAVSDAAMDECPHCPPEAGVNDSEDQRCASSRAPQVDARGLAQLHADNLVFHAVWMDTVWQAALPASEAGLLARYIKPLPRTRPIALTYCVQLK